MSSRGTNITVITLGVPILILVVIGIVLGKRGPNNAPSLFTQIEKAVNAGAESPQQLNVERTGRMARALILDVNDENAKREEHARHQAERLGRR